MNKILAPVDFSEVSLNAVQYAAHMAATLNKTLELVHVVQLPVVYGEVPVPIGGFEVQQAEAQTEMDKLMMELDKQFMGQIVIHSVVKVGSPAYELLEMSKSHQVYALVLGTHGAGAVERFFLGSVTLSVVRDSHCPVIVVPPGYAYRKPARIGLASDFKEVVKLTPDQAVIRVVEDFGARLEILHADPNYTEYEPAAMEEGLMLETMFEQQKPMFQFLHSGYTEETILKYAHENALDLLIIMPKHHGFVDALFKHQHTSTFVLNAQLPVMVVKCSEEN